MSHLVVLAVLLIAVDLVFAGIYAWGRASARAATNTMAASTNRLLFAIVILLFAIVFKLISTGRDVVVLILGLIGLGVGWYGISAEPR